VRGWSRLLIHPKIAVIMVIFLLSIYEFISRTTNSDYTDNIVDSSLLNNSMTTDSRKWSHFKRYFVGPKMPRRIHKQRREGHLATTSKGILDNPLYPYYDARHTWDRNAIHTKACPNWANKTAIEKNYNAAKELTTETNIVYEVDHIVPVKHPLVCGLHVEFNLQIIPMEENKEKSNNFVVD
jgi:hypothetical protein